MCGGLSQATEQIPEYKTEGKEFDSTIGGRLVAIPCICTYVCTYTHKEILNSYLENHKFRIHNATLHMCVHTLREGSAAPQTGQHCQKLTQTIHIIKPAHAVEVTRTKVLSYSSQRKNDIYLLIYCMFTHTHTHTHIHTHTNTYTNTYTHTQIHTQIHTHTQTHTHTHTHTGVEHCSVMISAGV